MVINISIDIKSNKLAYLIIRKDMDTFLDVVLSSQVGFLGDYASHERKTNGITLFFKTFSY